MPARVLLLDNTLHPRLFILAQRWAQLLREADVDVIHAPSARALPDPSGYTHLVLTGSEASPLRSTAWMAREAETVQHAARSGLRVLGSCFGHEMLVAALSGREHLARVAVPEIGWTPLEVVADDELVCGLPNPWTVFSFHFVEVSVPPPPPWRILARSRGCGAEILRWGDAPVWGIQGHPEVSSRTAEFATRAYLLLARRRGGVPRAALRRSSADDQAFFGFVRRFLGDREPSSG